MTQRSQRDGLVEQLNKARKHEELVNLTAPIDAVVLEIGPYSVNSVIAGAAILYRLVPANSPLEVQAMIDGSEIGFVKEGDPVEIKFDAYVYMEHGTAEGVVTSISEDSFSQRSDIASSPLTGTGASAPSTPDIRTGLFYKVKIAITAVKLRNVPAKFALLPGLPLSAEIKIGGRTVMSYLLRPLLGGLGESMREP